MTIRQEQFKKRKPHKKERGHGAALSNVRFRWKGPGKKTAREARQAFKEMLRDRKVPEGWQVAVVQWGHPNEGESLEDARRRLRATDGWMEGDVEELFETFSGLFAHYEHELQVGVISDDTEAGLRRHGAKEPRAEAPHGKRVPRRKGTKRAKKKNTARLARRGRR